MQREMEGSRDDVYTPLLPYVGIEKLGYGLQNHRTLPKMKDLILCLQDDENVKLIQGEIDEAGVIRGQLQEPSLEQEKI